MRRQDSNGHGSFKPNHHRLTGHANVAAGLETQDYIILQLSCRWLHREGSRQSIAYSAQRSDGPFVTAVDSPPLQPSGIVVICDNNSNRRIGYRFASREEFGFNSFAGWQCLVYSDWIGRPRHALVHNRAKRDYGGKNPQKVCLVQSIHQSRSRCHESICTIQSTECKLLRCCKWSS